MPMKSYFLSSLFKIIACLFIAGLSMSCSDMKKARRQLSKTYHQLKKKSDEMDRARDKKERQQANLKREEEDAQRLQGLTVPASERLSLTPDERAELKREEAEQAEPTKYRVVFGNRDSESGTDNSGGNGEKEYTCYYCSATKLSKDLPDRGRCPESPKKDEMSGYGHQWEESGKPVNRY